MMVALRQRAYAVPVLVTVALLLAVNAALNRSFVSPDNWAPILAGATPFIVTALAQAAPILAGGGGIDLSVGPLAGLVNAILVAVLVPRGLDGPLPMIGAALALGALSGLLNGAIVCMLRVQPIIATLGSFLVYQGLTLEVLPTAGGSAPAWLRAASGRVGWIPGPLLLLLVLAAAWLALGVTAYRRNLLAVGGDERAAYAAGIDVAAVRIIAYVIAGMLAAVAGLAFTAVLGSADPSVGVPYTLTSVAGAALGGLSLAGGRGGMLGAAAGGALLFLVQNLLTLAQVSIFYLQIATGLILLAAVAINAVSDLRRRRSTAAA
ncbi:MAG TPA: ABC transporter permease [Acetobacteraceae bacterium]|nr:ABC transporter permease [Acetobacteraceae bacterium]